MDEQKVPYIVFEGEQARHERTVKRLILALLISVLLLFASNIAWLNFFDSFEFVEETVTQDTDDGGMGGRSYDGGMSRRRGYSNDGYYYDDGNSYRRGRAANGRFVSRDGSEMARKLREMMADAPDDNSRQEIQRLAERMEQM